MNDQTIEYAYLFMLYHAVRFPKAVIRKHTKPIISDAPHGCLGEASVFDPVPSVDQDAATKARKRDATSDARMSRLLHRTK